MHLDSIKKNNWFTDYTVQWRPLMMCNYDCSYCSPSSHLRINKNEIPEVEHLIQASKHLVEQIPSNKSTMVVITGGEPFLIKKIHLWLDYLLENNFWVMIFTNGSFSNETYAECKKVFSNDKLLVKLSFHPETSDIEKFSKLANSIQELGADVEIRAMLANTMFSKIDSLQEKTNDIKFVKLPVFPLYNQKTSKINQINSSSRNLIGYAQTPDDGNLGYFSTEELMQLKELSSSESNLFDITVNEDIEYSADKIQLLGKNIFTGWQCEVVSRKLVITPNGDVHYGICNNEGIIGNIFNKDLKIFDKKFTICKQKMCGVIEEIMITKNKLS